MISARQMVEEVNRYLIDDEPDFEFEHWSEQDLLDYFRLAVEIVASTQKDKFTKRTTVRLTAGRIQDIPKDCRDAPSVLSQVDASGMQVAFPRQSSQQGMHLLGRIGCKDCGMYSAGDYRIDSWSADKDNPNIIYVNPPVPDGADAAIELVCFVPPTVDTLDSEIDLGAQLRPTVFHLMLYYAYGRDTESVPFRDRSAAHLQTALALLGSDKAEKVKNKYSATRVPELTAKGGR